MNIGGSRLLEYGRQKGRG